MNPAEQQEVSVGWDKGELIGEEAEVGGGQEPEG